MFPPPLFESFKLVARSFSPLDASKFVLLCSFSSWKSISMLLERLEISFRSLPVSLAIIQKGDFQIIYPLPQRSLTEAKDLNLSTFSKSLLILLLDCVVKLIQPDLILVKWDRFKPLWIYLVFFPKSKLDIKIIL